MTCIRWLATLALGALATRGLRAQCPNGTQCPRVSAGGSLGPRHVDPPLDDATWIVIPFNNVTHAPDVDWLRDASVNLLCLDLSRWRDIHIVDDSRVADLLRRLPEARVAPLSLDAAMTVARRAGAGRLVMGNVIKQGSRTTLVAKVFDVRHGRLLRSPQQDLVVQDSLMSVFGRLARGILEIAPPPGSNVASIGTSRTDAYREYLAGTLALNRFDFNPARTHLERALELDSAFALAHYKMAILIGWDAAAGTTTRDHAAAAVRLSAGLPSRERTLMKAFNALALDDYAVAREAYGALVDADSSDVEALYGLGQAHYNDHAVLPLASDTTRFVYRGSWNTAAAMFERALRLDPSFHLAFQHILDEYTATARAGWDPRFCSPRRTTFACSFYGDVLRDHDTLVTIPVPYFAAAAHAEQSAEYVRSNAQRLNLLKARDIAQAWVADAPDENRAHEALGHVFVLLGDAVAAKREFDQLRGVRTEQDARRVVRDRIEVAVKLFDATNARRLLDSIHAATWAPLSSTRLSALPLLAPAQLGLLFGRTAAYEAAFRAMPQSQSASPVALAYALATYRAMIAGATSSVAEAERAFVDALFTAPQQNSSAVIGRIPSFLYALEMPRLWPALDYPANNDHRAAAVVALSRGDTVRLRSETIAFDSVVIARPAAVPDSAVGLFTAQAFLVLHDTAAALRVLRRMLDSTLDRSSLAPPPVAGTGIFSVLLIMPRLELMRADLESAAGDKVAARIWYKRFLDLWGDGDRDSELRLIADRARAAYVALGPSGR